LVLKFSIRCSEELLTMMSTNQEVPNSFYYKN